MKKEIILTHYELVYLFKLNKPVSISNRNLSIFSFKQGKITDAGPNACGSRYNCNSELIILDNDTQEKFKGFLIEEGDNKNDLIISCPYNYFDLIS